MATCTPCNFVRDRGASGLLGALSLTRCTATRGYFSTVIGHCGLRSFAHSRRHGVVNIQCDVRVTSFSVSCPFAFTRSVPARFVHGIDRSSFILDNMAISIMPFERCASAALTIGLVNSMNPVFRRS